MEKKTSNKRKQNYINKFVEFDKPNEPQQFPHFRRYKKSEHPAMITGEHSSQEWKYRKVMHSKKDGKHLNEEINPNPNPLDIEPMYVAKRVRHDKKSNFSSWRYKWKIKK